MNYEEINKLDNNSFLHDSVQANKEINNKNKETIKHLSNNEKIEKSSNEVNQNENQLEEEE